MNTVQNLGSSILLDAGILPEHPDYSMYIEILNGLAKNWITKKAPFLQSKIIIDYSKEHTSNIFIDPAVHQHIGEIKEKGIWEYTIRLIKCTKGRPFEEINKLDVSGFKSVSLAHLLHFVPPFKEEGAPFVVFAPDSTRQNLFRFSDAPSGAVIEKVQLGIECQSYYVLFILKEQVS